MSLDLSHDTYVIRRKFLKLFGNEFRVFDPAGSQVLFSRQKAFKLREDMPVGVSVTLREVPEVEDCWFVAGEESYVVKVRVADVGALEHMIGTLTSLPGVSRTRTTVVLSTKFEGRVQPAR